MTNRQKWFILICFVIGCIVGGPVVAQLQQSGGPGSTVTANIGTTNGLALDATLTGGTQKTKLVDTGGTNVGSISAAGALKVDGSAVTQPISGTVTINAIPTGTNVIGKSAPLTSCGTTPLTTAWAAVPTSSTAVTGTTTCVSAIVVTNTNGTATTITVTDGQGSPITVLQAFSIPPNSQVTFPFFGTQMTTGLKWSASGTGLTGAVAGVQ